LERNAALTFRPAHRQIPVMTAHRASMLSLCVAAALAPLAAEAATSSTSRSMTAGSTNPALGAPVGDLDYSLLLGLDVPSSIYHLGPRLIAEGMYGYMDLSPQTRLKLGGRASFAYHGSDIDGVSTWFIEAVPDAKIEYAFMQNAAVYGDFGLGLALVRYNAPDFQEPFPPFETVSATSTDLALTFQFGGGMSYAVSPTMNVLAEVRVSLYTKSNYAAFWTIPTVGLQWHM
jgi:opacity protein-like surface antigen